MQPNYRRCLSCGKVAPKTSFWRIVRVYPSSKVQLDRGMGRSAYLCPQASCLQTASQKNRLGRSLRTSVSKEIYQTLWDRLNQENTYSQQDRNKKTKISAEIYFP
ncbi:MAG: YlxR family protein [Prochloraceae cyanobacterium]